MRYLLAGFDGSERSRIAVRHAASVAERCAGRLHVLTVMRLPSAGLDVPVSDDIVADCFSNATNQLALLRGELDARFAQFTVRYGEPAQEIARYALEFGVRDVFLGDPRRMMPRIMSTGWRVRRLLAGTGCEVTSVTAKTLAAQSGEDVHCSAGGAQSF
ncbi:MULTISPECIES: universal stress protein [Burkholderiaceae]|jgi:K+-sensing histidine kinase KdpD|uniref:Universal stress protein n=1 Tax=Burkholderia vietnamiensis TaxID=60552 RepID=A0AAW7TAX8_BURVI|nr:MULTISPECIES: universal stress protein [Burkholderiaceae]MDN7799435.1 universal stress protein [Burkholderia vietnamiensis]RFU44259.1 universal stress protein [Paraburkholderia sp. DHOC27]